MERHAVVMVVYNNLEMTKAAVESVFAQDIGPIELWIIDNGSTDGTGEWLRDFIPDEKHTIWKGGNAVNESPVKLANKLMRTIFGRGHQKILGLPNDAVLPPNMYREMMRWPRGLVTASMTSDKDHPIVSESRAVSENTPMAVAMIRAWAYDALMDAFGYVFDEITQEEVRDESGRVVVPQRGFFHYASDCDFALNLAACGIHGVQLDIQYWHYGSASWRTAPHDISSEIRGQADVDRAYFFRKWGFGVSDARYGETAGDINFRGERVDGR